MSPKGEQNSISPRPGSRQPSAISGQPNQPSTVRRTGIWPGGSA